MGRFLVTLKGENLLLSLDGEHGKFDFTASQVVEAPSEEDAERIALIRIHQQLNQSGQVVPNSQDAVKVSVVATKKLGLLSRFGKKRGVNIQFSCRDETVLGSDSC